MTHPDDTVFIGTEDGIATYAKRENVSGIDIAMQRDHMRRVAYDNAAWAIYHYHQRQKQAKP